MKILRPKSRTPIVVTTLIATMGILGSIKVDAQDDSDADGAAENVRPTVLITGANRGLGLELARQYSEAGWAVIGTARSPDRAPELRKLDVQVMQLDVSDQESVDRLADDLRGLPIDMLINNAGILPLMWTVAEMNFDDINRLLTVNTVGPMRVSQALLPNLRQGELKRVINISSDLSSIENNTDGGFYGYRESKAALNMFTRSIAAELRTEGFTCIVIHPGWVQTDMGGAEAPISPPQSVQGMRAVIDQLTAEDNGTFWTFDGKQMAW